MMNKPIKESPRAIVKPHSFTTKIESIKNFSRRMPSPVRLGEVATEGTFLRFTDHNVTGAEVNKLTSEISEGFSNINDQIRRLTNEFGDVYEVFQVLDKEYIAGILRGIEDAQTASSQALDASGKAGQAITGLRQTIDALQRAKNELRQEIEAMKREQAKRWAKIQSDQGATLELLQEAELRQSELAKRLGKISAGGSAKSMQREQPGIFALLNHHTENEEHRRARLWLVISIVLSVVNLALLLLHLVGIVRW